MGNAYYAMQIYQTALTFYEESLTNSGGFLIIYEYTFSPIQPINIYELQEKLLIQYHVDIIPEALQTIITKVQQETNQKPQNSPYYEKKQAQPWEYIVTYLFQLAGIKFPTELINLAHQTKQLISQQTPTPNNITKRMSWDQFEIFLQKFFEKKGYFVTKTKKSHDYGADLLLQKQGENIIAVQIKKWKKNIGVKQIMEIFTAKSYYNAQNALIITTSRFTNPAKKLAEKIDVECWDWERLIIELQKI